MVKLLAIALLLVLAPGCILSRSTVNEPLVAAKFGVLKPGVSTATDVANALGAPTDVVQLGSRMAWRYDFGTDKTASIWLLVLFFQNSDTRADRAWLFFDANNVLQYASMTLEAKNAQYAMPWENVHEGK